MTRSVDDLLRDLRAFQPTGDGADNVHRLNELLAGFGSLSDCERIVPEFLALLERHPQADFGTPGPLATALECQPGYADQLAASLERQPTELGAWMAMRMKRSTSGSARASAGSSATIAASASLTCPSWRP